MRDLLERQLGSLSRRSRVNIVNRIGFTRCNQVDRSLRGNLRGMAGGNCGHTLGEPQVDYYLE